MATETLTLTTTAVTTAGQRVVFPYAYGQPAGDYDTASMVLKVDGVTKSVTFGASFGADGVTLTLGAGAELAAGVLTLAVNYTSATTREPMEYVTPTGSTVARSLGDLVSAPYSVSDLENDGFFYLAHRGLPAVYPEHTLEAYRASLAAGAKTLECDCYLLSDGALGVMHDATLTRTTTSTANTADQSSASWQRLVVDASSFLGGGWADTRAPLFEEVVREFGNRVILTPEAKNTGSGAAIVALLQRYGVRRDMVVVSSFSASELTASISAGYPTAFAIATYTGTPTAAALAATGYRWIVTSTDTTQAQREALRAAGLKVVVYTPNTRKEVAALSSSADGAYTDDEIYLRGIARRSTDPFALQTWWHGHQASNANGDGGGRGAFYSPNMWGINSASGNIWAGALQGWANPIGGGSTLSAATIDFTIKFESAFDATRFAWIALADRDSPITADTAPGQFDGYSIVLKKDGTLQIYRYTAPDEAGFSLGQTATAAITDGTSVTLRITLTATTIKLERLSGTTGSVTVTDSTHRDIPYLHMGAKGGFVKYSGVTISGVAA